MSRRLLFNDPRPSAPPIAASLVKSSLMSARDVCYVVHSYIRPLVSLDAYTDDYYRWGYDDRKSRNLLMLGGVMGAPPSGTTTEFPKPVWREEKVKVREIEDRYLENVDTRAKEWAEKRAVLGRIAKTNVRRPRALLATGALSSRILHGEEDQGGDPDKDEEEQDDHPDSGGEDASASDDGGAGPTASEYETEEERTRAYLWSARLAVDRGYDAYLSLVELRRLLQTDGAFPQVRSRVGGDVEDAIVRLHSGLGVRAVPQGGEGERKEEGAAADVVVAAGQPQEVEVRPAALARTLSLPKGRMLLSRCIDDAILPHASARKVLPAALGSVLRSPPTEGGADGGGAPPRGEDRMLRSLAGLVRTVRPSVRPRDLLDCLDAALGAHADRIRRGGGGAGAGGGESVGDAVRSMLGRQRTRMEVLHAVLSRGNEICGANVAGADLAEEWSRKEGEFLSLLSKASAVSS